VTAFLLLVFALAYPSITVWGLAYHGVIPGGSLHRWLHVDPDEVAGVALTIPLIAAALYVTWASEGRAGVARLLRRVGRWRVGIGWWLLVLTGLPVVGTGFALLFGDTLTPVDPLHLLLSQLGFVTVNLLVINLWEEMAWSGVFQTRLERRHNLFLVALLAAVAFATVHLPLQFFLAGPVTPASLLLAWVGYLLLGVVFRPMPAVFLRGTADSLLLVGLLHSVFNRTNNPNGILGALVEGEMRGLAALAAAATLTAVTALVIRHRLDRDQRRVLDATAASGPARTP
jgi:membrane protease YdiL (CAAX protease family)